MFLFSESDKNHCFPQLNDTQWEKPTVYKLRPQPQLSGRTVDPESESYETVT